MNCSWDDIEGLQMSQMRTLKLTRKTAVQVLTYFSSSLNEIGLNGYGVWWWTFSSLSTLNIPRPRDETLSRHSFLALSSNQNRREHQQVRVCCGCMETDALLIIVYLGQNVPATKCVPADRCVAIAARCMDLLWQLSPIGCRCNTQATLILHPLRYQGLWIW